MTGIGGVKYLFVFLGLVSLFAFENTHPKKITVADCAFHVTGRFLAVRGESTWKAQSATVIFFG